MRGFLWAACQGEARYAGAVVLLVVAGSGCGGCVSEVDPLSASLAGDLHAVRLEEAYEAAHAFAGSDARLIELKASCVESDGTINLYADYGGARPGADFTFVRTYVAPPEPDRGYLWPLIDSYLADRSKERALQQASEGSGKIGSGTRVVYQEKTARGRGHHPFEKAVVHLSRPGPGRSSKYHRPLRMDTTGRATRLYSGEGPLRLPVSLKAVWDVAIREGAPPNAVADIHVWPGGTRFEIVERVRIVQPGASRVQQGRVFLMQMEPGGRVVHREGPHGL